MNPRVIGIAVLLFVGVVVLFRSYPSRPPLRFDSSASSTATPATDSNLSALRAELNQIKSLLGSTAPTPAATSSAAVPLGGLRSSCPPCPAAASCPACPAAAPAVAGPSADAAARCAKLSLDFPPEVKRITMQVCCSLLCSPFVLMPDAAERTARVRWAHTCLR
jgi:hypothetical protein